LNRIPRIDIRSERIEDKTLFIVQVEEGDAKPYFNVQTNEIFIRRGASDVRPNPDTDLKQMLDARNALEFGQFN
jgi:predicted HTH transcriptional regulator